MSTAARRVEQVSKQHHLQSKAFREYLHERVFVFPNGSASGSYSRSDIARLTETPCIRAAFQLYRTFGRYRISSIQQLYNIGLDGLLRCRGLGERAAWVAAVILEDNKFNVSAWCAMQRRKTRTVRGSIRLVSSQTKKQKH